VAEVKADQDRTKRVWTLHGSGRAVDTLVEMRRWAAENLTDLGQQHLMDTMLVAVELINNAYDHGGGVREVRVTRMYAPCRIDFEVDDFSTDPPVLGRSRLSIEDCRGRGVLIVDKLSEQWGMTVDSESGCKTVWAQISCEQAPCATGG
jgi:anti-sigma regulatory factor (Ser/Thr protein kinase)